MHIILPLCSEDSIQSLGKDKLQIQKVEYPFRLTRSASCNVVLFSDHTHLRTLSCLSLALLIHVSTRGNLSMMNNINKQVINE